MKRTSVILVAVTAAVLGGTLIASAQVSSGSPDAAQQNFAKKESTDKPVQNDQQNATTNRRQEAPKSGHDEVDGVHIRNERDAVR